MITYHVEYTESGTRQIMRKGPYSTKEEAASALTEAPTDRSTAAFACITERKSRRTEDHGSATKPHHQGAQGSKLRAPPP